MKLNLIQFCTKITMIIFSNTKLRWFLKYTKYTQMTTFFTPMLFMKDSKAQGYNNIK